VMGMVPTDPTPLTEVLVLRDRTATIDQFEVEIGWRCRNAVTISVFDHDGEERASGYIGTDHASVDPRGRERRMSSIRYDGVRRVTA